MYVKSETGTERPLPFINVIEDIPGGGTLAKADVKADTVEVLEGAVVGKDTNGLYHLVKTAKIVSGGSASAPRIAKSHEFKIDDVISDGVVALTIASITEGETYDTLSFDSGSLTLSSANQILYQVETEDTTGSGTVATAVVTDDVADTLTITIPVKSNPANFNGITVTIEQNGSDALAVSYSAGVLLIKLAKTTAASNNVTAIQAAIRALGVVAAGIDFSLATATGAVGWDNNQTGAVLTVPSDDLGGGVNYGAKPYLYTPAGLTLNTVDTSESGLNAGAGIMVRGTVKESLLPYYIDAAIKATLPHIRFE